MQSIIVKFKDNTEKKFVHRGRPSGSYTINIRYEGSFAIVEDEYGDTWAYPVNDIKEVLTTSKRSF